MRICLDKEYVRYNRHINVFRKIILCLQFYVPLGNDYGSSPTKLELAIVQSWLVFDKFG